MTDLRKPRSCPNCSGCNIKRIVGGTPDEVGMALLEAGKAVIGDCFARDWKEDWHCADCGHQWCDRTDPARIELEELLTKIKEDWRPSGMRRHCSFSRLHARGWNGYRRDSRALSMGAAFWMGDEESLRRQAWSPTTPFASGLSI